MRRLGAAWLLAALLLTACARAPQLHQREAYVFGTRVEVSVWGESADKAAQALAAVLAEFDRLHRMLHAWQPSELTADGGKSGYLYVSTQEPWPADALQQGRIPDDWLEPDGLRLKSSMKHLVPQDYPEQAFSVRYALKDLSYARELARETGVDARASDLMHQVFEEAVERGDGDRYTPVIRRGMLKPKK